MPRILKFRRGTTSGLANTLGSEGELFVDTSLVTVIVHNGITTGGVTLARASDVNTLSSNVSTRLTNVTSQTVATSSLSLGTNWTINQSSNGSLYFYYGGVAKFRFDSSGTLTAVNDLIAVGTI
jgi:hypothetical protein